MRIVAIVSFFVWCLCNTYNPVQGYRTARSGPRVEDPVLLNSYLPAAMQVIAHLTDLMKYDVKPATPSTTTPKPTSPHRPGIFAPPTPPSVPTAKKGLERRYGEDSFRVRDRVQGRSNEDHRDYVIGQLPEDLDLLGIVPKELLTRINTIDDYDFIDDDQQIQKFSENYDDFDVKQYVIGNKKSPPTRAYVTLLSIYDQLNAEAKKLKLNKYGGYTPTVLKFLQESSTGTSAAQLHAVLTKLVENKDTDNQRTIDKIQTMIKDLNTSNSYINQALRYVPPLHFDNNF